MFVLGFIKTNLKRKLKIMNMIFEDNNYFVKAL